jgi:hypothetical protein
MRPSFYRNSRIGSFDRVLLQSPLMKEFLGRVERQTRREGIEDIIEVRFGALPKPARDSLQRLTDEGRLDGLPRLAALCLTLEAFVDHLEQQAAAAPASRRSRKR